MCLSSNVEEFWQQHQQQLSKARYTLATKSIIAETGDKSAAKSTVAVDVQLCCRYGLYGAKAARSTFNKVDRVEFNFVASVYRS